MFSLFIHFFHWQTVEIALHFHMHLITQTHIHPSYDKTQQVFVWQGAFQQYFLYCNALNDSTARQIKWKRFRIAAEVFMFFFCSKRMFCIIAVIFVPAVTLLWQHNNSPLTRLPSGPYAFYKPTPELNFINVHHLHDVLYIARCHTLHFWFVILRCILEYTPTRAFILQFY